MYCMACGCQNRDGAEYCKKCGKPLHDNVQRLGAYELRGELGRGAMARVWRGWDPRLNREVAIKEPLFDTRLSQNVLDEMGRRFVREGVTAAQLNHPNIVTIYEADVYDGRPAIVMELVDGVTLSSLLEKGRLEPAAALDAVNQLLDAVSYAHGKGIVHRDIKPDNVFVDKSGRVKLADFGIAHVDDPSATRATIAGAILGTLGYMSPEQIKGNPVDARSDLFSVGVVAYELFTGRNPFGASEGADQTTLMYRTLDEPARELPASIAASLPVDVRPAIMAALAKDPADRPQSADDFKTMLNGGSVPSGPSPKLASVPGPSGGKWLPYVIVGAIGVVVILAILISANASRGSSSVGGGTVGTSIAASENEESLEDDALNEETSSDDAEKETSSAKKEDEEKVVEEPEPEEEKEPMLQGAYPPRFTSAVASSELPDEYFENEGHFSYGASLVLDNDSHTAWNEGASGPGAGQWIRVSASSPQLVNGISIQNGYPLRERTYYNNNRVKDLTIELSDGYTLKAVLNDAYNQWQDIKFDEGHDTTYIKITIESVYDGQKYDDTCIAEISAY